MASVPPVDETSPPEPRPSNAGQRPEAWDPPALPELQAPPPAPVREARGRGGSLWDEGLSLLYNRFILAGLGTVAVLLLIAIVLVVVGSGDATAPGNLVVPEPTVDDGTPVVRGGGLAGRARITLTVRNGPGLTYSILGTL